MYHLLSWNLNSLYQTCKKSNFKFSNITQLSKNIYKFILKILRIFINYFKTHESLMNTIKCKKTVIF